MTEVLKLEKFIQGGELLARWSDGRAVFVPFGMPGERVRVDVYEDKQRFLRARILDVLEPSSQRVAPRCPYFAACGGCHYQHMHYQQQLDVKRELLREQLIRIAGIAEPDVLPTISAEEQFNYRNAVQFHLTEAGRLGFVNAFSDGVLEVTECHLPLPEILDLWHSLDLGAVPGVTRVELRSDSRGETLVNIESDSLELPELDLDFPASVVLHNPTGQIILAGDDYLLQEIKGRAFSVSAASFFQVNVAAAERMADLVLQWLAPEKDETIFDLYCGVGLFSAFIAPHCRQLVGVEGSESACEDFAANLDEFENVSLYQGWVEEVLPHLDVQPDGVVLDPPRAGLKPVVIDTLAAMAPSRIVYASCDPATLARDLKKFIAKGYSLQACQPVDMFPQTASIETVAWLTKSE